MPAHEPDTAPSSPDTGAGAARSSLCELLRLLAQEVARRLARVSAKAEDPNRTSLQPQRVPRSRGTLNPLPENNR
jgi:hypothetical protein